MADQRFINTICKYCTEKFRNMTDPRELPCHHIFCRTCLQGDRRNIDRVFCPICREVHQSLSIDQLPKATKDDEVATTPTTTLKCDGHEFEGHLAVSHCIQCGDNFCVSHQMTHKAHFGDKHEEVPIHVYEQSPERYDKPICKHHQEALVRACKKCDKLICFDCDDDVSDCTGQIQHDFHPIRSLNEEADDCLKGQLESAKQKLKEWVKLDKEICNDLDIEEVECEKRVVEIKRFRDKQINSIKEESEEAIRRLCKHQEDRSSQMEIFCADLVVKKEQLEETTAEIQSLMRDVHITEQIRQKQKIAEELNRYDEEELGHCPPRSLPVLTLPEMGDKSNIEFINMPTSLTLRAEYDTNSMCCSANYKQDGDILVGTVDGVQLLDRDGIKLVKYSSTDKTVGSVVEYQNNIYILHIVENVFLNLLVNVLGGRLSRTTYKVEMCLPGDMTIRQELFEFTCGIPPAKIPMAVSDRYIVVRSIWPYHLILYNCITKQINNVDVPTTGTVPPADIHFLPDGHLLVPGKELTKCRIDKGKLSAVWTCGLDNYWKSSICSDSDGLIYVFAHITQEMYIISPDGVKLGKLTHDKLPMMIGQISIKDGVVAVPGLYDRKLYLFRVNRGDNSVQ